MEKSQTIEDFYHTHLTLLSPAYQQAIGHFNVHRWADLGEGKPGALPPAASNFIRLP